MRFSFRIAFANVREVLQGGVIHIYSSAKTVFSGKEIKVIFIIHYQQIYFIFARFMYRLQIIVHGVINILY